MKNQIFIPNIFQAEALEQIDKAILANERAFLIVMPPATGKTYLAAQWFRLQLEKNPKARLLFVCHNQDILSQANDKEFANCLSEFDIPRAYYNKNEKNIGQVTFATVQTLMRNLEKFSSDYFDYIIVDEAHHYRAKSFEKTIKHFSPKVLLGLTATPYRMDGKSILNIFNKIVYSAKISNGIKNGLLSKIKYYYVDNDIDFSEIKHDSHGRYDKNDLNKKICIKEYDDAIVKEYNETIKQKYGKKKTICYCATVEHAHRMENLFNNQGIKSISLTGKRITETGKKVTIHDNRRKKIVNMFKNGDYDIIFVRDLFNEGIDIPDADCIMMLRPTESSRIFTQQLGRGLRISEGKNYLLILDFTGNCYNCNINYEFLNELMDVDLEKEVINRIRDENPSEIIIQNIGCDIRLSKKKIDIIKASESEHKIPLTDENLIKNYWELKKRYPNLTAVMVNKKNGSQFGQSSYSKMFGSWNKFLELIGEPINQKKKITNEDLIRNYWELKKRYPNLTTETINKKNGSQFGIQAYYNRFGSWNNFLVIIGERTKLIIPKSRLTIEDLIKNYWELKKKFPNLTYETVTKENGSQCDKSAYDRHFGSWNKFLESIGQATRQYTKIADKDLIKNYWELKKKFPNLTVDMVNKENGSKFSLATYCLHFGSWNKFLELMGEKIKYRRDITDEELIKNYWELKKKFPNLSTRNVTKKNGSLFNIATYYKRFGSWFNFLDKADLVIKQKNITIISDYTPKNPLPNTNFKRSNKKFHNIKSELLSGYKYIGSDNKDNIRQKIIDKIQDGDIILILESPELDALKEIDRQGKIPKKIIIPNHFEFDDLAAAMSQYNSNLKIEVINTSALQYLVDHPEEYFNFIWLDYCGAFSYYIRDLDIIFQRNIKDMKLILTYNVFDPMKRDESYYFTNVISYVLKKLCGKNQVLLMDDISQRYKKLMFSIGFDIKSGYQI